MFSNLVETVRDKRFVASFTTSTLAHLAVLILLSVVALGVKNLPEEMTFESLMKNEKEKPPEHIQVMTKNDTVSKTLNTQRGGTVSAQVRSSSSKQVRASSPTNPNVNFNTTVAPPSPHTNGIGSNELAVDLGEDGFKGQPTARVAGYADALNRITYEIIRLMRKDKLLVVWLFDESESMKDDQKEIANNFHVVYKELGIQLNKDKTLKKRKSKGSIRNEVLMTAVYGYGENLHQMLAPTADVDKIIKTIRDDINIDKSGKENMCTSITRVLMANRTMAAKQKRKMMVVVVSDESGDDGMAVEETIKVAKKFKSPVYFLGREAIFGYPYARHRWVDPKYKLTHWLRINRGPETSYPECLQWDGLHARWDALSSGFGPYEQVRIARESNGVFFVLPGEEENLAGEFAHAKRQYDLDNDMREYHPMWMARSEYALKRQRSRFRQTIWNVIVEMNPTKHQELLLPKYDPNLNIRQHHYPVDLTEFKTVAQKEAVKALVAWKKLGIAIKMLDDIAPLRAREESQRWRANYDLILAQCLAFRVRLFQFMLTMDAHVNASPPRQVPTPKPGQKKSNEWWFQRTRKSITPDQAQYERVKQFFKLNMTRDEMLAQLKKDEDRASELYKVVLERHPGTPWAVRSQRELVLGYGMLLRDVYWNPKYRSSDIKFPKF